MTDIFREIEEDVRRERYAQLWKKYGDYAVAVAALVIIAVAGFKLWQAYESRQDLKASDALMAAQVLPPADAAQTYGRIAQSAPSGYAVVARLNEAGSLLISGRENDAIELYKKVIAGDDPLLADVARIRAGWAMADTASRADLEKLLGPTADPNSAWHYLANEVLAYSDFRTGNMSKAQTEFQALANAKEAPDGVKERAGVMASFIAAGGEKNIGTVPPPQTEAPAPGKAAPPPGLAAPVPGQTAPANAAPRKAPAAKAATPSSAPASHP